MHQITLFLYNTHIRWRPFLAHFRENFDSLKITNYPGLIPFFQPGKLFRGQKCLSTNFRAKKNFFPKKFSWFWWKRAQIVLHFLRVSNSQHVAPRASPTKSLAPLKSLVRALSNGARLEVGGACGADPWLFENARKHAKSRTLLLNSCVRIFAQTMYICQKTRKC